MSPPGYKRSWVVAQITSAITPKADLWRFDFRCWGHSGHPNDAAGLPVMTQSGHPASIDSSPTKQQNFDDNVYLGDLRVK